MMVDFVPSNTAKKIVINNIPECNEPTKIPISGSKGVYQYILDHGMIDAIGSTLRTTAALGEVRRVLIVTDTQVGPLYLRRTETSLKLAGFACSHVLIAAGESSKSMDTAHVLWNACCAKGVDRSCAIIALGGGVVGDIAGFVASTYLRGLPLVQVPTTLIAMTDSSIGGKTAVNLEQGKNLAGTFWQPSLVLADIDVLDSLPYAQWQNGLGEIAKMAVLGTDDFFFEIFDNANALANRNYMGIGGIIEHCARSKADLVTQDEFDILGIREQLNLGHTLAHAIESVAGYGVYGHGNCVATGIRYAAEVALRKGLCSQEFASAQNEMLDSLGIPPVDVCSYDTDELIVAMHRDKKNKSSMVRMVLAKDVGDYVTESVADDVLIDALSIFERSF